MRFNRVTTGFAIAAFVAAAAQLGAQDVKLAEEKSGLAARAKIAFAVARATAQARIPAGKLITAEVEEEGGKLIYTMVFKTEGKKGQDEVNVDAATGKIVAVEHEKDSAPAKKEEKKEDKKDEKKDAKKEVKKS